MATTFLCLILIVCFVLRVTNGQALGFVLNGEIYPNGSTVLRTDIGEEALALQCTTDRAGCCRNADGAAAGEFYFPNGTQVPILGNVHNSSHTYYRNRGTGFIRLNRRTNAMETGQFRCEIPDASGTLVNLFINIESDMISLSITASGTNTAGETYSLMCSATVNGSSDQPTITWLDPMNSSVLSEMVTTIGNMSTLTFNPLADSHAGTYTCRVTVGGVTRTQTSTLIVNVITAQVTRSNSGPLTAGQTGFSLSCDVTGTENLNKLRFIRFEWWKNGELISGWMARTLSLSPLTASNAGEYNCSASLRSTSLSAPDITVISDNTTIVTIQFSAPNSVCVTSDQPNPIQPIGSTVTLTCTVVLAEYVESLTVNTEWTGPSGFSENGIAKHMGSTTTYTSTAMVSSFGRDQSGNYNCTATVSSTSSFLTNSMGTSSTRVTSGVYLSLKGVVYPNNSVILITEIEQTNTTLNNGLQCITDRSVSPPNRAGEWLFPDGGMVPPIGIGASRATTFYRNRGSGGTVNLNRLNNDIMTPTGRFCCVVPDATSIYVTVCANITLSLVTTASIPSKVTIDFKLTSSQDSTVIIFSLMCNSTGSPVSSVIWTRNGLLLDNTGPLFLSDASTASYTNVLQVNSRTPGTYTCQIRGGDNEVLSSVNFTVKAAPPPLNIQATQSSASAPVEVSWSPPSSGATNITGYRIFYGSRGSVFVTSDITGVILALHRDSLGETVSVRSEAYQLASQLITVTVTTTTEAATKSSALDVGVTFGVMLLLLCVVSVVFTLVLIFMWRKRRVGENDLTNMPTQLYEEPDKLTSRGPGNYELTQCPAYATTTTKTQPPPTKVDQSSHRL